MLQRQQAFCFWTKTFTIDLYVLTAAFRWEEIITSFYIWDISECRIIAIMKLRPAVNYVTHKNTEVFFYWLTVAMCCSPEYLSSMLQKHTNSFIKYPSHYLNRSLSWDKLLLLVAPTVTLYAALLHSRGNREYQLLSLQKAFQALSTHTWVFLQTKISSNVTNWGFMCRWASIQVNSHSPQHSREAVVLSSL